MPASNLGVDARRVQVYHPDHGETSVKPEEVPELLNAGWSVDERQTVVADTGVLLGLGGDDYEAALRRGEAPVPTTLQESGDLAAQLANERAYDNDIGAAALGAARGFTFGASDAALSDIGLLDEDDLRGYKEGNPVASTLGEAGAIIGASVLSGGAAGAAGGSRLGRLLANTPAGALSRGATKLGQRIGGTKGLIAGEMVEGMAYGTGQAVSNLVFTNEPLTAETASAELLQDGFLGAAAGGVGAGAFKLGEKAFKGLKGLRANKKASILDHTTDEGRVFTGDLAKSIQDFDEAGAAALGAKFPKEVQDELAKALETERKALLSEIDDLEAIGLGYMQRAGADLRRAEKDLARVEKNLEQVGRRAERDVERQLLQEVKQEEKLRGRSTANPGRKRKISDTVPDAQGAKTVPEKRVEAPKVSDTIPDIHAEQRAGLRAGLDRMAKASENFKVRQLKQLDKLTDDELAKLAMNSREYAEAIDDLGHLLGAPSPAVRQFADTVQDRLPGLLKMYRENQEAALGGPLGKELADARSAMRKALGVKAEHKIGPKHISDIFKKSPEDQLVAFEAIDNHFKVAKRIAEETGDTTMLEGVEATLAAMKETVASSADAATLKSLDMKELLVAAGLAEATPNFEGPIDDIAKFYLAHKLISGRAGAKGGNFVRQALGNVGARVAAQKGWQAAGGIGAGIGSAAGYKVFAGLGDRLGMAGGLSASSSKTMKQIAESVHKLAQTAARSATKGSTTATAVLKATQFSDQKKREESEKESLQELFKKRSEELQALMSDPWQLQVMINDSLEPVRQTHSGVGDKIEMQLMKTAQHLYDTMPKDPGTLKRFGVSRWKPSEYDIHKWARRVEAAQNPMKVVDDTFSGGTVTPQAADTLRELYPSIFQEVQLTLVKSLPELQESVTYDQRVRLSTLYGVALDPAMERSRRSFVQEQLALESQQQAQAPQARPSNSTTNEEPTGAQKLLAR